MATAYKVKAFSISTDEDFVSLEEFLATVKKLHNVVQFDGKVLIIYEEN